MTTSRNQLTLPMRSLLAVLFAVWLATAMPAQDAQAPEAPAQPTEPAPAQPSAAQPATDLPTVEPQRPQEQLPRLADLPIPTVEQLLKGPSRDWVILDTSEVVVTEPIAPRPNTIARVRQEQDVLRAELTKTSGDEREAIRKRVDDMNFLFVVVPDSGSAEEYRLPVRRVVEIRHHEDLMIQRIDMLLSEGQIPPAMELLAQLERTWDDWPGLAGVHNRILFADADVRVQQGQAEQALMLLNELFRREPSYAGLSEKTGQVMGQITRQAIDEGRYRQAQYFLNRLSQRYADHSVFQTLSTELSALTQARIDESLAAAQAGDHRLAAVKAEEAAVIWPRTPSLKAAHRSPTERYQRLHVGVLSFPHETQAFFPATPADQRERSLVQLPLFETDRIVDGTPYYRTRFFDEWEPVDLGRRMRFTLRQFKQPFEMQAILTAHDVVQPLVERLDPESASYDERIASIVASVAVESPTQFTVQFRRVPPRVEPHLAQIYLGQAADPQERTGFGNAASLTSTEASLLAPADPGGMQIVEALGGQWTYARKTPEPDGLPQYHIAEIVEHRYPSHEKAMQGLLRGEVSMLPDVPDWIIRRMQADEAVMQQYFVVPYSLPTTHLLQFNPSSKVSRIPELRRALAYAIDRPRLLKDIVLQGDSPHGRLSTGPFPSVSPAKNVQVQQLRYDLSSAVAMALAASKKVPEGLPTLRFIVAPGPIEQEAAADMARIWKRIGINVELVAADDPAPESWDIMYRTLQMPNPSVNLWPFLAARDNARLADLVSYPDWFKQDLVDLDRISDQSRADAAMQEIHRRLWIDTTLIPLWEVDQFAVVRKVVRGLPQRLMHPYDRVDRWMVDAWYEAELP